jgi:Fe2+ transport system protein FeoA
MAASSTSPSPSIALSQLRPGQSGVVKAAEVGTSDAALLGAMGLCCNAKVRLCRAGEPCIVAISSGNGAGCRIGLARPLAERIMVEVAERQTALA